MGTYGFKSRVRVAATRPLLQWVRRTPSVRERLLARRRREVEAGLDPDTAILLELSELTGEGALGRGTADLERVKMMESIAIVEDIPLPTSRLRDTSDLAISDRSLLIQPTPLTSLEARSSGMGGRDVWMRARLYAPRDLPASSPGLVFVHGGGWVTGDLDTHDTLCQRIARLGRVRVLALDPKLAPEHPFPTTLEETLAAFRHVIRHASDFGMDPDRVGIGGDSAGGNLSAVVSLATRHDDRRPRMSALLYPAVDATCSQPSITALGSGYILTKESIDWYLGHYIGDRSELRTDPRVGPLHAADHRGAPPSLVVVAGYDPLVDEGVLYAETLKRAGVEVELLRYDSLVHGFLLMTAASEAASVATDHIARRIGEMLY